MNSITKITFSNMYPHVLVKTFGNDGDYYCDDSQYCSTLEDALAWVTKQIKTRGVASKYPKPKTTTPKVKPDLHEKARIEQFMMETGSTPTKYNARFKAKVLARAEKCSTKKLEEFASTLRWFGMERLAVEVESYIF